MNFRVLVVLLCLMSHALAGDLRFYIGTYTKDREAEGIYSALLDEHTGEIRDLALAHPAENPSFLALSSSGRFLYAAEEASSGRVAAFAVALDGRLKHLNTQSTRGKGACHVAIDPAGQRVFAANYGSGSAIVFSVAANGELEEASDYVEFEGSGPDPARQERPHAHAAYSSRDGRFLYVCDLGTDKIHSFRLEHGKLSALSPGLVPPGSGPRHLAFSRDERFVFVCNEMGLTVTAFSRDLQTGLLSPIQNLPLLPDSAKPTGSTAAEISLHPNGRWLYVSTRGHDSFTVFAVAEDGTLTGVQNVPSEVKQPRGFGIEPGGRWLVAAGQADDRLCVFAIDQTDGRLQPLPQRTKVSKPVAVLFAP